MSDAHRSDAGEQLESISGSIDASDSASKLIRRLVGQSDHEITFVPTPVSLRLHPTCGQVLGGGKPIEGAVVTCGEESVRTNAAGNFAFHNNYLGSRVLVEKQEYSKLVAVVREDYITLKMLDRVNLAIDLGGIESLLSRGESTYRVLRMSMLPTEPDKFPITEVLTEIAIGEAPLSGFILLPNSECPGSISTELMVEIRTAEGIISSHFGPNLRELPTQGSVKWYVSRPRLQSLRRIEAVQLSITYDGRSLGNARVFVPSSFVAPRYWNTVRTNEEGVAILPIGGPDSLMTVVIEVENGVFSSPLYCPPVRRIGDSYQLDIPRLKLRIALETPLPSGYRLEVSTEALGIGRGDMDLLSGAQFFEFPTRWATAEESRDLPFSWTGSNVLVELRLMPGQYLVYSSQISSESPATLRLSVPLHEVKFVLEYPAAVAINSHDFIVAGRDRNDASETFLIRSDAKIITTWLAPGSYQVGAALTPDSTPAETVLFEVPSRESIVIPIEVSEHELSITFGGKIVPSLWGLWPTLGGGYQTGGFDESGKLSLLLPQKTAFPIALFSAVDTKIVSSNSEYWVFTGYSLPVSQLNRGLTVVEVPACQLLLESGVTSSGTREVLLERLEYPYTQTRLQLSPESVTATVFIVPGRYKISAGGKGEAVELFAGASIKVTL